MNKISKVYYEKTQEHVNKHVLFVTGTICFKNFVNFQGKHPCGSVFLNKLEDYLTPMGIFS